MSIEIECPSGLVGKIRGLEGKDGRYLADPQLNKTGELTEHILGNCWQETVSPAFYKLSDAGHLDWQKVLLGDRMYILMKIRVAGRGGDTMYQFPAQCMAQGCRRKFEWEIDLDDLPVQRLSEAVREQFAQGVFDMHCFIPGTEQRRLESLDSKTGIALIKPRNIIVPNTGTRATFRLPTGKDEAAARKLQLQQRKRKRHDDEEDDAKSNDLVQAIIRRTSAIEGISKDGLSDYFEAMSLDAIARLLDRYDEQDCGVETTIEIECNDCGTLQDTTLPFGTDFFFQRTKKTVR